MKRRITEDTKTGFQREHTLIVLLGIALFILGIRAVYERNNPVIMHGQNARMIVIPSTGKDIKSPVSFLFGRAPFFIVCDKLKGTYKAVPNKYMDTQHAAGLKASQMIKKMNVDVVCANNIGFEPMKIFQASNIEVYTHIKGTVWDTLQAYPTSLTRIDKQNVPSHFGITGSKKPIACSQFDATANVSQIVQGKYYMCLNCGYKVSQAKLNGKQLTSCPKCGGAVHEVITVATPKGVKGIKPKIRVF